MGRSLLDAVVRDLAGNIVQGAKVFVFENGTTTPVTDFFPSSAGGVAQDNFVSSSSPGSKGRVRGWATTPRFVRLRVTDNSNTATYTDGSLADFASFDLDDVPVYENPVDEETDDTALATVVAGLAQEITDRQDTAPTVFNVTGPTYGAVGDGIADDSAEVQAAITAAAGSEVWIPEGTFLVGDLTIATALRMRGPGTLKFKSGASYMLTADSGSADPDDNIGPIDIQGPTLVGRSVEDGFSEHKHLLNLNGVSDVTILGCGFEAWQGDAVYLGSGNGGADERHNRRVKIGLNTFDGVTNEQRNAVSVIDGDDVTIALNTFRRCSKTTMPGPVDVEPDNIWNIVRDIKISGNTFDSNGGNVGDVGVILLSTLTTPPQNIAVTDNAFYESRSNSIVCTKGGSYAALDADEEIGLLISGNVGRSTVAGSRPVNIGGVRGVLVEGNVFADYPAVPLIGFGGTTVKDISMLSNVWQNIGATDTYWLHIGSANRVNVLENDIEVGGGGGTTVITLGAAGATSDLLFALNRVRSATPSFVSLGAGHTTSPATNKAVLNVAPQPSASVFAGTIPISAILNFTTLASAAASVVMDLGVGFTAGGFPAYGIGRGDPSARGTTDIRGGSADTNAHGIDQYVNGTLATRLRGNGVGVGFFELSDTRRLQFINASGPQVIAGTGTPEGAVTAPVGSLFLRTNGGAATSVYVKESGTGNTGWVGK